MELSLMSKKAVYVVMATLFLLSILTLKVDIQSARAESRTWTVDDDTPADFHTIQEAINAADPGDAIYVKNGTYYEHLVVNKPLTLVGASENSTIIDGSGTETVIQVTANNVIISRFTVQNSGSQPGTSYAGIKISGRAHANLTGNHVTRNKIGIFVTSQKSRIAENDVTNNGQGIALYDSSEVTVEANNVTANTVGISLALSSNNIIVDNSVTNSSPGGHGITLSSNSFNNTIFGNNLTNNYHGIWLSSSSGNWIVENNIANNELLGIELASSSSNTFYHNNIVNNPTPVRVDTDTPNESICIWDDGYPSGGNYWHDYTDVDEYTGPNQDQLGSDDIWDKPYVLDENNKDRYPSVKPYGEIPDITDKIKPTANAGPNQTVKVGTSVYFDASESTGNIVRYEWDFGDGTRGTGFVCSHTYTELGTYTVTLTVKKATGNSDTDLVTVTVVPVESFPSWIDATSVVIGIAIVAALFWKLKVSKRIKKKRRRKMTRNVFSSHSMNIYA
jgi:parallel beta-helix repeat protein